MALIPDDPVQSEITEMKKAARDLFGSGHALNSPAHITLIPPFFASEEELNKFLPALEKFTETRTLPRIDLNGFDHFGKRVIFVDVMHNPSLMNFQKDLFTLFKKFFPAYSKPNRFHPHLTIAFKDLDPNIFPEAWAYFGQDDYAASFLPAGISLLRHKNKQWYRIQEFPAQQR